MDSPSGRKKLACMEYPCKQCGHCPAWNSSTDDNMNVYTRPANANCRYSVVFRVVHLNGRIHYWHRIPHDHGRHSGRLCECLL